MENRQIKATDQASDKVFKLLPADVTGAYLAVRSIVQMIQGSEPSADIGPYVLLIVIILLTVITPPFLKFMGLIEDLAQRLFIAGSFVIWAINIDSNALISIAPVPGIFLVYGFPILLILWAFLAIPVFLRWQQGSP